MKSVTFWLVPWSFEIYQPKSWGIKKFLQLLHWRQKNSNSVSNEALPHLAPLTWLSLFLRLCCAAALYLVTVV